MIRAFDYYFEAGDVPRAVAEFPVQGGNFNLERAELVSRALPLVTTGSPQAGRLLFIYGFLLYQERGDYEAAQEALSQALSIARREGDEILELRTLVGIGHVEAFQLSFEKSLQNDLQAIELANRVDDPFQETHAYLEVACVLQHMGDLEGAALYLKGHANSNGKVGIIGFCSGGRYTLMFGCTSKNVDAAVDSAGGGIITDELTPARPKATIDMVADLSCPLLALFGDEDENPSPAHAARLKEELDKHGKTYEFKTYSNAGHAFFADYRPSYRAAPAQDMWHRVLLFYEKHLKS